jgi:putative addiction module component (TIGR02574 family)
MTTLNADAVLNAALALPLKERAEIAHKLLQSLDDEQEPDAAEQAAIDKAWLEEIGRRVEDFEQGRAKAIPYEEVLRSIRERLKV